MLNHLTTIQETEGREVLLWHDAIHESQDRARLHFWRLSFSPSYDRESIFERLDQFYREAGITSHIAYETLGDYDLLLRMWVPRHLGPDEVDQGLWQALRGLSLWNINYMQGRTIAHWTGGPVEVPLQHWPADDAPVIQEVSEFNRRAMDCEMPQPERSEEINRLIERGVLRPIPIDTRGIRFFIIFDHPRLPFNPKNRVSALREIVSTCEEVLDDWKRRPLTVKPPLISIYQGSGPMTEFLIMARAPHTHFHEFVSQLLEGLRQANLDSLFDMRPYTHVIADQMFSEFAEDRRPPQSHDSDIDLQSPESESLEYKATFALNVRRLVSQGEQHADDNVMHAVVRAVCGLLNSPDGGTLVIGLLEVRRELERTKAKEEYLTALRRLFGYSPEGASASVDLPNAVIGVEAEVGDGKLFPDLDSYSSRIFEKLRADINPIPNGLFTISFPEKEGRRICVIRVKPAGVWFYARAADGTGRHDLFYAREGSSTRAYYGTDADLYRQANPRNRSPDVI